MNDLTAHDAPGPAAQPNEAPLASLRDIERRHIERVLEEVRWNIGRASRILGISRWSLARRLRKHGVARAGKLAHA
jgi:transcriptional regulator of acetoin/glycerol metabolism